MRKTDRYIKPRTMLKEGSLTIYTKDRKCRLMRMATLGNITRASSGAHSILGTFILPSSEDDRRKASMVMKA